MPLGRILKLMTSNSQNSVGADLEAAQNERALARWKHIQACVSAAEHGDEHVRVGLKAFDGICDYWAIDKNAAESILLSEEASESTDRTAQLVERLSYLLRIHRLMAEVIQGDQARHQRWIRRATPALDGQRPIDLMTSAPLGSAKVMEYLEFCQHGHSS